MSNSRQETATRCYNTLEGIDAMELLVKGTREIKLQLSSGKLEKFEDYYRELTTWNQRMNLTAIVDYREAQLKHFLDSLTTALVLPQEVRDRGRLLDIGSGGGFPGVPLKLAFPSMHLTLVDSVAKKTAFLEHLVEALELQDVEVCTKRAEDLAMDPRFRESFDVVVSRGVASIRILMELALPFCRLGGMVVTLKKGDISHEVAASIHAMDVLGGRIRESRAVDVDGLRDGRVLVVVDKINPSPPKFPRRPGLPAKHPL